MKNQQPFSMLVFALVIAVLVKVGTAQDIASATTNDAGPFAIMTRDGRPVTQYDFGYDRFTTGDHADRPVVTRHQIEIDGQTIHYEAKVGTMLLVNDEGATDKDGEIIEEARIFFIAYRKIEQDASGQWVYPDPGTRPITFSFNGGPGSSSVWLHLGIYGPKRVAYADEVGNPGPAPYDWVDNHESLLDQSDFVFIDPVSTGFSRAEGDTSVKDFHGVEQDIDSVAEFIRRYVSSTHRWRSPKYLTGESYGTTRAAGLASRLESRHGMAVNGVILVSSVLNFQTIRFNIGNDLPPVLFLPTFAATAHYHGRLSDQLQRMPVADVVDMAERFAIGEYASAMMLGDLLPEDRRRSVRARLSELTGLSEDYLDDVHLRPSMPGFCKELLRDEGLTVGRLDSRFIGRDRDDAADSYEYDPSYSAIQANYTGAMNGYVREELGFKTDLPYQILTSVWPWDYGSGGNNRYLNVAERLRNVMEKQPGMRVFIASGYYDLATPHFATEYTVSQMMLREGTRANVEIHDYAAGHMMYVHRPSRIKLREDLVRFYDSVETGRAVERAADRGGARGGNGD
jgi:carboxypeptidase C (cathepsin A)